jgi:putative SOS response-associated peptidase YedK
MRVFVDWPWSEDARYGAPFRAHIHTRRWFYVVGVKSQVWTKSEGWTDRFAHVTRSPEKLSIYERVHRRRST